MKHAAEDILDISPAEIRTLVHELQTHQIELELQNENLRRTQDELVESRDRYSDLYNFAPVGYTTLSSKGFVLDANLTLVDMLGIERSALVQRHLSEFIVPDDQDIFYRHRRTVLDTKQQQSCQLRMLKRGADPIWTEWDTVPLDVHDPDSIQLRIAIGNITERQLMEERLRQASKMEAVGQLAAGVAHEFNNLLSGILNSVELVLATYKDNSPESLERPLRDIKKCAQRGAGLTTQLLSFARKKTPHVSLLDVNQVIGDLDSVLQQIAGQRVTLVLQLAHKLPPVRADRAEIEQAVVNLARNACAALTEKGTLTIGTTAEHLDQSRVSGQPHASPGPYVQVFVADNGCGMTPEILARIFEPFFTTKPVGEGTGLGLATVFADVTKSGGFIEVESRVGEGTVLRLYLPAAEEILNVAPMHKQLRLAPCPGGSETILVVDDDQVVLNSTAYPLESRGYSVLCAQSTRAAVEVATNHDGPIQLLVTDVSMPEMNGRELARKLTGQRPDMKVLFMSGYAADVLEAAATEGEQFEFLQKPPQGDALFRRIRKILDTSSGGAP